MSSVKSLISKYTGSNVEEPSRSENDEPANIDNPIEEGSPSSSDGPAKTTTESGYKPSDHVKQILDDAEKSGEAHRHEGASDEQAGEARNEEAAPKKPDETKGKTEGGPSSSYEPAKIKTESGYKPSDHVKQILEDAKEAEDAKKDGEHATDTSHYKKLDEPTAKMSVHEKSRQEE